MSPATLCAVRVSGWLAEALDREFSGQGSTPGCDRERDFFITSESALVQTPQCPYHLCVRSVHQNHCRL